MYKRNSYGKNKTIYTVLLLVCVVGFWLFENFYTPDTYSVQNGGKSEMEVEEFLLPSSTHNAIVQHNHYMLSYSEEHEQAEWVAYILKKSHITYDDRKRPYFIEDPRVRTKSADWRNYKGSGYDRGHLCPAGDRRFTKQAYDETFYTSNITPQDRDFNAGVWNRLEQKVRDWAKRYDQVFVITAGVLESGLEEIGEEDVDVPRYYYKIVVRGNENNLKAIAFLMEGRESTKALKQFTVPIDTIEEYTGIDFFSSLNEQVETKLESSVKLNDWKF